MINYKNTYHVICNTIHNFTFIVSHANDFEFENIFKNQMIRACFAINLS